MNHLKPREKITKPIPVFLNTNAGAFKQTPQIEELTQLAQSLGLEIIVKPTASVEELHRKLTQSIKENVPIVIVAGGDGTISEAVQILAHTDTALGIIPTGTANNFATALRLPMDLPSALRVIKHGKLQRVSLGKIDNRYFTEAAGVGLFADALALYGQAHHKNIVKALYTLIRIFLDIRGYHLTLEIDGKTYEHRAVMCTIANTFRIGYGIPIAPTARLSDDCFEVIIFGDISRREIVPYFRAMRTQLHPTLPKVTVLRAKKVMIQSTKKLNVHIDDTVCGTTPFTAEIHPQALTVIVDQL